MNATECLKLDVDMLTEIAGIVMGIITFIYELLAARSRDNRVSSPFQFLLTIVGKLIYKATGRRVFGRMNKIEPNSRQQLLDQLVYFANALKKEELWVEKMKHNESIHRTVRKKQTIEMPSAINIDFSQT